MARRIALKTVESDTSGGAAGFAAGLTSQCLSIRDGSLAERLVGTEAHDSQPKGIFRQHGRVLLIGDTRQRQGVEAGRPFEQLQEARMRATKLDEIVRQKNPALKSAVEMLATGQVSSALDALQKQGRVREIPDAEE